MITRDTGEYLQHSRADTAALQCVLNRERHLGAIGCLSLVKIGGCSTDSTTRLGNEDAISLRICPQQSGHLLATARRRREKSGASASGGQAVVQLDQPFPVPEVDQSQA